MWSGGRSSKIPLQYLSENIFARSWFTISDKAVSVIYCQRMCLKLTKISGDSSFARDLDWEIWGSIFRFLCGRLMMINCCAAPSIHFTSYRVNMQMEIEIATWDSYAKNIFVYSAKNFRFLHLDRKLEESFRGIVASSDFHPFPRFGMKRSNVIKKKKNIWIQLKQFIIISVISSFHC